MEGEREWGVFWVLPTLAWAHLELGEIEEEAERCFTTAEAARRTRAQGLRQFLVESLRVQAMIAIRGGAWDVR